MNLTSWAWLIVPVGLCRAMQIVLWDRISLRPRRWLLRRLNPEGLPMTDDRRPYLSFLLECPWCLTVWLGGGTVALLLCGSTRTWTLAVLAALALSVAAVAVDGLLDRIVPDKPAPAPSPPKDEEPPPHVAAAFAALPDDGYAPGAGVEAEPDRGA